jgi:hypothetical protein
VTRLKANLKVFSGLFIAVVQQYSLGRHKVNNHMVTGLGFDVASQVERAAVVTHGQFNVP